jgi:hypothetical protein
MPLTAKGKTILSKFRKEYGAKQGAGAFYGAKNNGMISGVDRAVPACDILKAHLGKIREASDVGMHVWGGPGGSKATPDAAVGEDQDGVGAESWVNGRKNSTGYQINAADRARVGDARRAGAPARDALLAGLSRSHGRRTLDAVRQARRAGAPARDALSAVPVPGDFPVGNDDVSKPGRGSGPPGHSRVDDPELEHATGTGDAHEGFAKLDRSLAHRKGVNHAAALAAWIGRKKFGEKGMAEKSEAGRTGDDLDDSGVTGMSVTGASDMPMGDRRAVLRKFRDQLRRRSA